MERKNKLLSHINSVDDQLMVTAEYDKQSRLIKLEHCVGKQLYITFVIAYTKGNDIATITKKFENHSEVVTIVKQGNNLLLEGDLHYKSLEDLNNNGMPSRVRYHDRIIANYEYDERGNVKKLVLSGLTDGEKVIEYTYDDKIAPFYACTSPKWFFLTYFEKEYINNIIEVICEGKIRFLHYTYDKDNYALKYFDKDFEDARESYFYKEDLSTLL